MFFYKNDFMRLLKDLSIQGKTVLIRADLNVPLGAPSSGDKSSDKLEVTDTTRIKEFLPTLQYILSKDCKVVLMSHLGSPADSKPDPLLSLKPVALKLSELLKKDVVFANDCIGESVEKLVQEQPKDAVILLENLRFHPGEQKNDVEFAKKLSKLGEVFVCDAFATAHRKHSSMVEVPKQFQEKAAGFLVQKELDFFDKALNNPKRPLCVVLGGSKVSTKLNILFNIAEKANTLIIGGAMANTFLAAQGLQMGRSLYEPDLTGKALELLGTLARKECKVYLPIDLIVAPSLTSKGLSRTVTTLEVPADTMALDIGPATRILYKEALNSAETVLWNGPMGAFEHEEFSQGTTSMIEAIASSHAMSIVGGGDTDAAIHQMELAHKFNFISTAGGAFLALLEGQTLPGIAALS
jgi:phosphoglycerate kinase